MTTSGVYTSLADLYHKKLGFYYNPFHKHCGPFNTVSKKAPRDPIDRACWEHDKAYGKIGPKAYSHWVPADDKLLKDLKKHPSNLSKAYQSVFQIKKKVAPKLNQV